MKIATFNVNNVNKRLANVLTWLPSLRPDASQSFRVGSPSKSGVSGGILAIVPGVASIAVWSPALNAEGNSLIGTHVLEQIAARAGWSIF